MLNEVTISKAIISTYMDKLMDHLELDVAIVGAGPSGLVAGYYLAKAGKKVAMFEKKLSIGGGMWGGGMMFNEIVVQEAGKAILDEFELPAKEFEPGYYTVDSVDAVSTLTHKAVRAGMQIFNLVTIEDVVFHADRVSGLVINWATVEMTGLHVDPLTLHSRYVLDGTGHPSFVTECLVRKMGVKLDTETGGIVGERSMDAEKGEMHTVENTGEVYPGLFASGMAANGVKGGYRMGPVFGGMLLSGKKAAEQMIAGLDGDR
jgi:thiamine thiazole synthase